MRKDCAMSAFATQLEIVRADGGWSLIGDDRTLGHFHYRVDAEEAALRLMERARSEHRDVRVLVQDEAGQLQPFRV